MGDAYAQHHDYWDSFYAGSARAAVPVEPSAFAQWVEARLSKGQCLAEFGFGNARDSLWFAEKGHRVLGFDFAESAVQLARRNASSRNLDASFEELDLYDAVAVERATKEVATLEESHAIYGRFLIHSLETAGRQKFFDLASAVLSPAGRLFLEFRTGLDRNIEHLFGDDHFRIYLDPDTVCSELEERGATIEHFDSGYGRAVYKTEDPHVAEVVAAW